ncbi:MAG: hypothetical protein WKF54_11125 [Nocardioidaceae bacterium]
MALSRAKRRLASAGSDIRGRVSPVTGSARDSLGSALDDTRSRVGPALGDARERLAPALEEARDKLAPVAQQAIVSSRRKGRRAAVRLGLAEEPKQGHKFRNLLALLGLSGVGYFLYRKFYSGAQSWSEPSTATTTGGSRGTSTGMHTAPASAARPPGGGSDSTPKPHRNTEAAPTAPLASEETVESPEPTTPDNPLEEKQVDKES